MISIRVNSFFDHIKDLCVVTIPILTAYIDGKTILKSYLGYYMMKSILKNVLYNEVWIGPSKNNYRYENILYI